MKKRKRLPDFYPFILKCGLQVEEIKRSKEFKTVLDNTINATKEILVNAQKGGAISFDIENIESVATSLVSKADGLDCYLNNILILQRMKPSEK